MQKPHPSGLDDRQIALLYDCYISFWVYAGGSYEIHNDRWGLFVTSTENQKAVIADIERVLTSTGAFVKEFVDFEQFR